MTTRPCQQCATPVPWETIPWDTDLDLSHLLPCLCPECNAKKAAAIAAAERERIITAAQTTLRTVIPERMRETDPKHPEWNEAGYSAVNAAYDPITARTNLILTGTSGTCKSRILAMLLKRTALRGHSIAWTDMAELEHLTYNLSHRNTRTSAQTTIAQIKAASHLVLDDLGKEAERIPDPLEKTLFELINHRYNHNTSIWLSSNTHPQNLLLTGKYSQDRGAAIIGRLLESATIIQFT